MLDLEKLKCQHRWPIRWGLRYCKAPPGMRTIIHRIKKDLVNISIIYSRIKLQSLSGIFRNSFASKCSMLQCDFPRACAKSMFNRLAGGALAGRVHIQLIRISVSLGSDKLDVTLSNASASQAELTLGNFKVSWRLYPHSAYLRHAGFFHLALNWRNYSHVRLINGSYLKLRSTLVANMNR